MKVNILSFLICSFLLFINMNVLGMTKISINSADSVYMNILFPVLVKGEECPSVDINKWVNFSGASKEKILTKKFDRKKVSKSLGLPLVGEEFDIEELSEELEKFLAKEIKDKQVGIKRCVKYTSHILSSKFNDTLDGKLDNGLNSLFDVIEENQGQQNIEKSLLKRIKVLCEDYNNTAFEIRDGMKAIIGECSRKFDPGSNHEHIVDFACAHYPKPICRLLKVKK